ncbi:type II secretion system F family protein [Microcoleus sp. FACHB-672]|uniref:type II secretion system F family protein n=1 Tax=Microcoleus sp. FACHB-672 TaxID=2692825 RepID=UPI0016826C2D|nr:type II secretion system F family protein [Microcoleus sp. FACHB-672]MBD2042125.1 type II secretion system F family protein [Microcoleus sp. FACHB-672]
MPTNVAAAQGFKKKATKAKGFDFKELEEKLNFAMASVTVKDKAVFSRQLAVLINAGVPLVKGIGVLREQNDNAKMKKALSVIDADVQEGVALAEAMRKHDYCFDNLYVAMVQAGELGGVLDEVLNRVAKLLEDAARLQNHIKSATAYPKAVGTIAILVFFGMTTFLLPTFAKIFVELGTPLPALTLFMLACSDFFRTPVKLGSLIGTIFAITTAYNMYYKTPVGKLQIDGIMLKLPLFGDLIKKTAVARFCRTFGMLTRSGVPMLTSLEIVKETAGNQVIANAVEAARQEIQQGGMISVALKEADVFPAMAIHMMSIGEETGEIDKMLMKVADFYEDEVEQAVKALTSTLEPIMMVGIAALVGAILLSMYLPMFAVFDKLG